MHVGEVVTWIGRTVFLVTGGVRFSLRPGGRELVARASASLLRFYKRDRENFENTALGKPKCTFSRLSLRL